MLFSCSSALVRLLSVHLDSSIQQLCCEFNFLQRSFRNNIQKNRVFFIFRSVIIFLVAKNEVLSWNFQRKKMHPLPTNQRMLTWICVSPLESRDSKWMKPFCVIFALTTFLAVLSCVLSSVIFFSSNVSIDVEESLYALFQISAFSGVAYMAIVAFYSRKKINAFLETLTAIHDERKHIFWWDRSAFEPKFFLKVFFRFFIPIEHS